jgi:hypothetical protein
MKPAEKLAAAFRRVGDETEAKKAESGYYGDFTSPLAAPQTALYLLATQKGYREIVKGVLNGEYDG